MFWDDSSRKRLPMRRKHAVYKRAGGKCEKCGRQLEMNEGDFHHTRDPMVVPRAENIRFLCPTCHRKYGHKRKTIKREGLFYTEKESRIVRKDVVKIEKPVKKKPKTKRVAIRGIFGDVVGYRTVKIRSSATKKKKNIIICVSCLRQNASFSKLQIVSFLFL
jgi:DNA-directed RNA polymerase subunit M/transcription elongation factor TFIIS